MEIALFLESVNDWVWGVEQLVVDGRQKNARPEKKDQHCVPTAIGAVKKSIGKSLKAIFPVLEATSNSPSFQNCLPTVHGCRLKQQLAVLSFFFPCAVHLLQP